MVSSDPVSNCVASASKDGTVRVWDVRLGTTTTGVLREEFPFIDGDGDDGGPVCIGRSVVNLSGHTQSVTCLRWGGDGLIYSGSQDRTVKVYAADSVRLSIRFLPYFHFHFFSSSSSSSL
jgi:ribosome assembly protein 4